MKFEIIVISILFVATSNVQLSAQNRKYKGFMIDAYQARKYNDTSSKALNFYTLAIQSESEPNNLEAYYWRGVINFNQKRYATSVEDFKISYSSKDLDLKRRSNYYLFLTLSHLKEYELSLKYCSDELIAEYNQFSQERFYYYRAIAFYRLGKYNEALADIQIFEAMTIKSDHALFAFIAYKVGDFEKSVSLLKEARKELNKDDEKYDFLMGLNQIQLKNYEDAMFSFSSHIKWSNSKGWNSYLSHGMKGVAHYYMKEYTSASEQLEVGLSVDSLYYTNYLEDISFKDSSSYNYGYFGEAYEMMKYCKNRTNTINKSQTELSKIISTPPIISPTPIEIGINHALIIGNNNYRDPSLVDLDQPIHDATKLYNTLISRYTFEKENVTFLKDATRRDIIGALDRLSNELTSNDNLIIFYAGHGYWDQDKEIGSWMPTDAEKSITANWLKNSAIQEYLEVIKAKHTLLIADACFGGGIFKTRAAFEDADRSINNLYKYESRKAMTSGMLNEVPDRSIFMENLIERLNNNEEKYLSSASLFFQFRENVMNNSNNAPQYGTVHNTGDKGGDFIFILKDKP